MTQVLSPDLKKSPAYFNWNFPISWRAIINFGVLRELDRGENDVRQRLNGLRLQCNGLLRFGTFENQAPEVLHVCGLSFSQSQSLTLRVFLQVLWFSSLSKIDPANYMHIQLWADTIDWNDLWYPSLSLK